MMAGARRAARLAAIASAASSLCAQASGRLSLGAVTRRGARLSQALRSADHDRAAALMADAGTAPPRPLYCDWSWRPAPWQDRVELPRRPASGEELAAGVKIFHEGGGPTPVALACHGDRTPYRVDLEVPEFAGGYASIVVDLPKAALAGLSHEHLVGIGFVLRGARIPFVFPRLSIICGPNHLRALRRVALPPVGGAALSEFDMQALGLNRRNVVSAWCDIVLVRPAEGKLHLDDVILYRRPRAAV